MKAETIFFSADKICANFNAILKDYVGNIGKKVDYSREFSSIIGATYCPYGNNFYIVLPKKLILHF